MKPGKVKPGKIKPDRMNRRRKSRNEVRRMNRTIGFIGFGNMAGAIAKGWIESGLEAGSMYACAGHYGKLQEKCEAMGGIHALPSPAEVIEASEIVLIAVKPYMISEVIGPVKEKLAGKIVISVAAGYDFERYAAEKLIPETAHLLCTCPNTPVSIRKGIFVIEQKNSLTGEEYKEVETLLSRISLVIPVASHLLGIAGTVSGCGPAFVALFIEALGDAGVMYGIPRKTAYQMVSRMIEGTAAMQLATGQHPGAMKDDVCSPAGTTIRGIAALEENGFRAAVIDAIKAIQTK